MVEGTGGIVHPQEYSHPMAQPPSQQPMQVILRVEGL
jgi:hypothetical protein